ncbi:hypothetical protein NG798_16995 [Ancylothrix sp. C2]|nr:hypothetical protein [Ancylothrix sp. D3o]MCT7951502.1 hypothetical protein [Ancylothrix sp. D3o]
MENTTFSVLVYLALGLMLIVTCGVAYLTAAEWTDRRRQMKEKKERRKA